MKIAFFGSQPYDRRFFDEALPSQPDAGSIELIYHNALLCADTAILAQGAEAVCVFVNDVLDAPVLEALHGYGVRAILLRCAGYNNLDLAAAARLGLFVARKSFLTCWDVFVGKNVVDIQTASDRIWFIDSITNLR